MKFHRQLNLGIVHYTKSQRSRELTLPKDSFRISSRIAPRESRGAIRLVNAANRPATLFTFPVSAAISLV